MVKAELEATLRAEDLGPGARESLVAAVEECDRLAQLAEDLLVLARSADGALPVRREPIDAGELLESVRRRFADRAAERGREIHTEAPAGLVLEVDPLRLRQALGNLVDNALRHGEGDVVLRARRNGSTDELEVSDSGPGLGRSRRRRVRALRPRRRPSRTGAGAGLGLAIVRAVAEAHGGSASAAGGAAVRLSAAGLRLLSAGRRTVAALTDNDRGGPMKDRMRKPVAISLGLLALAAGGAGVAQAVGGEGDEENEKADGGKLRGAAFDRAERAALKAAGGGEVIEAERGDDSDGAYEVAVRKDDGRWSSTTSTATSGSSGPRRSRRCALRQTTLTFAPRRRSWRAAVATTAKRPPARPPATSPRAASP